MSFIIIVSMIRHEWFCKNAGVPPNRCLVIAHTPQGAAPATAPRGLQNYQIVNSSFEQPDVTRQAFDGFIGKVCASAANERK